MRLALAEIIIKVILKGILKQGEHPTMLNAGGVAKRATTPPTAMIPQGYSQHKLFRKTTRKNPRSLKI